MATDLLVITGSDVINNNHLQITSPSLSLSSSATSVDVVKPIANTYIYKKNGEYVQVIFTFKLLAALLDTAPTQSGTAATGAVLFQMNVTIPAFNKQSPSGQYVVDAQIQTKGNSAMSPTYTTVVTIPSGGNDGLIFFPVTNFFSVTAPGAPYTVTITITKDIETF